MEDNNAKIESIQTVNKNASLGSQDNRPIVNESIDNVDKSTASYLKRHLGYVISAIGITIFLEAALYYFLGIEGGRIYILPLLIPIAGYGNIKSRVQHEFMQQFAAANNFTYSAKGNLEGLDGVQFKMGHSQSVFDVINGNFSNCPISLLSYRYTIGYGRDSTTYNCTIFKLQFDTKMPDILLKNKRHHFEESMSGKINLKLEGNFNNYFTLSLPAGYEVEALEVFTPDVMADLIDKAKSFSLEIIGNHLFIYAHTTISTKQELYAFYEVAEYFIQKLRPVLMRMKSSVIAMQETLASNAEANDSQGEEASIWPVLVLILSVVVLVGSLAAIVAVNLHKAQNTVNNMAVNATMPPANAPAANAPAKTAPAAVLPSAVYTDKVSGMSINYFPEWKKETPEKNLATFDLFEGSNLVATLSIQKIYATTPKQWIDQFKAEMPKTTGTISDEKAFTYTMQDGTILNGQQAKIELPQTEQPGSINIKEWLVAVPYKNNLYGWLFISAADNFDDFKPDAAAMLDTWKIAK